MLRKRLCEATFEWALSCEGPLLIADGRYVKEKEKGKHGDREKDKEKTQDPDKVFVSRDQYGAVISAVKRARSNGSPINLDFYVPGTSLRGPFRSQAELIVRSLAPEGAISPRTACDPFEIESEASKSCSTRMDKHQPKVPYERACPACKLFGCTGTASRIGFTDSELENGYRSVVRDMIGIDRFTGGVHTGANMRFHALEGARFTTTVTVRNFELWQLGLLAYVFQDFADGIVPIGFGKSKGFGRVVGTVEAVTLVYPSGRAEGRVQHLGTLASEAEQKRYGLFEAAAPECPLLAVPHEGLALYEEFKVADPEAFWERTAAAFNDFIAARFSEEAA